MPEEPNHDEIDEALSPEDEAALLEKLELPVPETMKQGDDFSVFMKAGVPEFLRKRALRVLWRSNPVLANLDGLNDYDDDFTSPELTQKVLATGYRIGKGFLLDDPPEPISHEELDDEVAEIEAESDEGLAENLQDGAPMEGDAEDVKIAQSEVEESEESFRPRRMRFET